jgi:hypothetical protein
MLDALAALHAGLDAHKARLVDFAHDVVVVEVAEDAAAVKALSSDPWRTPSCDTSPTPARGGWSRCAWLLTGGVSGFSRVSQSQWDSLPPGRCSRPPSLPKRRGGASIPFTMQSASPLLRNRRRSQSFH